MQQDKNLFRKLTPEEKERKKKDILERENVQKQAEALAIKCLNSPDFVKYRERYETLEVVTIDRLIDYNNPDPMQYAFNVRRMLDQLRQLRLLLRGVQNDNRKKK